MGAGLPLLLCGPVLRRVEPRSVSVWVALSEARTVRLDLWSGLVDVGFGAAIATPPRPALASATTPTRRIGDNLHLALVTLTLDQASGKMPLAPGTLYSYNVTFTGGSADADLRSLGLLQGKGVAGGSDGDAPPADEPLGYQDGQLPNFATVPAQLEDFHFVHCSCSRMQADGEPLMQNVDDIVKDNWHDPLKRPHQLFLTGDQIYADDVATALLPALNQLGARMLGVIDEQIPVTAGGTLQRLVANETNFPAGRRQVLVTTVAGMTTDFGASHLLAFAEFAAMYVLTWSPAAWPRKNDKFVLGTLKPWTDPPGTAKDVADANDDLRQRNDEFRKDLDPDTLDRNTVLDPARTSPLEAHLTPFFATVDATAHPALAKATTEGLFEARKGLLDDRDKVEDVAAQVWKIRRALASIPTYAICDDHEVTDDWFLTQAWRNRVLGNTLGKTVIRNAVAAYVLFQGWGNDPAAFAPSTPGARFLDAAERFFPAGAADGPADAVMSALDPLFGFDASTPQLRLDYVVDGAAHRVIVMDSRTRRAYQGINTPPQLLSDQALADQIVRGPFPQPLPAGFEVLIVVSPAPQIGPPVFEELLWPFGIHAFDAKWMAFTSAPAQKVEKALSGADRSKPTGSEFFDAEGWSSNHVAQEKMFAALAGYGVPVIVLGGDVHYASSWALDYEAAGKPAVRMVHLTSSAAQNLWPARVASFMASVSWTRSLLGAMLPAKRFGWHEASPAPLGSVAGEPPPLVGAALRHPVLIPANGWLHHHDFARPPDWRWELTQIVDVRNDADRPPKARPDPIVKPDMPPAAGSAGNALDSSSGTITYGDLAHAHALSMDRMFLRRGALFSNNFGHVSFARDAHGLSVSHELHSIRLHPDPNEDDDGYTLHAASLSPAIGPLPRGVGPA
jgi:hypothetical protein